MEKRFQLPRYQLLNSTISSCNNGPPSPGLKIRPGAVWLNGKSAAPQESLFRWHPRCAWLPGTTRVSAAKYFVFLSIFLQGEKKKRLTAAYQSLCLLRAGNWRALKTMRKILDAGCPNLCCHLVGCAAAFSFFPFNFFYFLGFLTFIFSTNRFIPTIFLDSIYIHINIQRNLLFSFWLTQYDRL